MDVKRVGVLLFKGKGIAGGTRDALLALAVPQPPGDTPPVVHHDEQDAAKHLQRGDMGELDGDDGQTIQRMSQAARRAAGL